MRLYAMIGLTGIAMGVRNATIRKLGVPDLTTTVPTLTIAGFAADSSLARGSNAGWPRRVGSVVAMLAGAAHAHAFHRPVRHLLRYRVCFGPLAQFGQSAWFAIRWWLSPELPTSETIRVRMGRRLAAFGSLLVHSPGRTWVKGGDPH
jgi:uncharacterized protein DUF1275